LRFASSAGESLRLLNFYFLQNLSANFYLGETFLGERASPGIVQITGIPLTWKIGLCGGEIQIVTIPAVAKREIAGFVFVQIFFRDE
jgi:hypothetical protein